MTNDPAMMLLPAILYILCSILLVVLIILGIKLIITMNKIEHVVDDISVKVSKLDGLFSLVDSTTDKLARMSDTIVNSISSVIRKLFRKRKDGLDE